MHKKPPKIPILRLVHRPASLNGPLRLLPPTSRHSHERHTPPPLTIKKHVSGPLHITKHAPPPVIRRQSHKAKPRFSWHLGRNRAKASEARSADRRAKVRSAMEQKRAEGASAEGPSAEGAKAKAESGHPMERLYDGVRQTSISTSTSSSSSSSSSSPPRDGTKTDEVDASSWECLRNGSGSEGDEGEASEARPAAKGKTVAEVDRELRERMAGRAGEGGEAGVELEEGKAVGLKRGVKANMFRVI